MKLTDRGTVLEVKKTSAPKIMRNTFSKPVVQVLVKPQGRDPSFWVFHPSDQINVGDSVLMLRKESQNQCYWELVKV
jgi:hypothetical protein